MKKVAVFLAEGFEEIESVTPIDYLRRAGVEVLTVSVSQGRTSSESDERLVTGAHGVVIRTDTTLAEFIRQSRASQFDGLFVPGGMPGALNVGQCDDVTDYISTLFRSGRLVTAICAAPVAVLAKTGVLAGRKYTCYPGMEQQIPRFAGSGWQKATAGAVHVSGVPFVTDGNLVTGRGPGAAEQFAMELVRILCGEQTVLQLKEGSCQR